MAIVLRFVHAVPICSGQVLRVVPSATLEKSVLPTNMYHVCQEYIEIDDVHELV